ncbi:MAG: ATP-dependent zinc metalloprotease FtsH [Chloroflexi bacterium]|nr:ATP-dependent zinc metalloprotease FtsH [Chloroflexota bacterium]
MGPLQWILVLGGMLLLLSLVIPRGGGPPEIGIGRVMEMAEAGELALIEVDGDELEITTLIDETFRSRKEAGVSVLELLKERGIAAGAGGVQIEVKKESLGFISILVSLLPMILIAGLVIFMLRRSQGGINQAMRLGRTRARPVGENRPEVTFNDVAGADEAKQELIEVVEFLSTPEKFTKLGAKIPKGILLVGPPGTGKTLISRAVAGEASVPFFATSGSEFVEVFVGVGASRVRDLFAKAKASAPAVIFVDEIDAVGRHRGAGVGGGNDEREQTLNQILVEMDGFDERTNVIVIAATNRPDILDPALVRPGRFDRRVVLEPPDIRGRGAILAVHLKGKPAVQALDLRCIARETPGFSGADLANLANEAAILAAHREHKTVTIDDLLESVDRVTMGPERRTRVISQHEREIVAYHEGGHALVGHLLDHADPVQKISIVSRGMAAGYTKSMPIEDHLFYSKPQLMDRIAMALGGRAAEEITFGEVTTGASNDLEQVTQMARAMVTRYGMGDDLLPRTFGKRDDLIFLGREIAETRDYSEKSAQEIDSQVEHIIEDAHSTAKRLLTEQYAKLVQIARHLIAHETVEGDALEKLFASEAPPLDAAMPAPA